MTAPNISFPQADAIIEQLTTRIHELIGTDYRDAAIDAASRAEGYASRAETAADNAEVGIRDGTVAKQHLTPGLREELDGKADKDHEHDTSDLTDYPGHSLFAGYKGTIPVREPDSDNIRVGNAPTERYHLTNRAYVDERIQLVTAWPASPVAGVLYLMEE